MYVAESIATDCRMFRPRRTLSTVYKTVLYTVDKGLWGPIVLQSVVIDSATYVLVQDQFSRYQWDSNESLQHHTYVTDLQNVQ